MRLSKYKLAAVSALALSAAVFAAPQAFAQGAPGDVAGTMQPVPAPGAGPTYNNTAPLAGQGSGASGIGGDRAGDVAGSMPAVPAPAGTTDLVSPRNGQVTADPGSRAGDVAGSIQPVPLAGGAVQCQAIYDMADRQTCINRTQGGR